MQITVILTINFAVMKVTFLQNNTQYHETISTDIYLSKLASPLKINLTY